MIFNIITKADKCYSQNYNSRSASLGPGNIELHMSVNVTKGAVIVRLQPITLLFYPLCNTAVLL